MNRSLRSTAYHEAGHAAAMFYLRRAIVSVSIVPGEDHLGVAIGTPRPSLWQRIEYGDAQQFRAAESCIFTKLAGPEAEARLLGRRNHTGASFDHADCLDLACSVWQAEVCRFIRRADVWAAIQALAARLLERRTVSGRVARSILRQFIARRRGPLISSATGHSRVYK